MRREFDAYFTGGGKPALVLGKPTPVWAAQALYCRLPQIQRVAEPCVGTGDLIAGREDVLWTNDVDENREATYHLNAAAPAAWGIFPRVPWVVTNPPFNLAHQILTCALDFALEGVAMLLRLSFLEPTEQRAHMLNRRPPTRMLVLPRISFTGDGKTDNVTCAWLVWSNLVEPGIEIASRIERLVGAKEQKKLPWA
jgi:hypothetical protein